jgi:hypothetical protein
MLEDDLPLILNHKSICCGCIQYHQTQDLERKTRIDRPLVAYSAWTLKLVKLPPFIIIPEELGKRDIKSCNLKENVPVENAVTRKTNNAVLAS